jgi:hypothetical protein
VYVTWIFLLFIFNLSIIYVLRQLSNSNQNESSSSSVLVNRGKSKAGNSVSSCSRFVITYAPGQVSVSFVVLFRGYDSTSVVLFNLYCFLIFAIYFFNQDGTSFSGFIKLV